MLIEIPASPTTADFWAPLTPEEGACLERVYRFLMAVVAPPLSLHAVRMGYDRVEHQQGWGLWLRAAGVARPFEHQLPVSPETRRRLIRRGCVRRYEAYWRPLVCDAIRAHLPAESASLVEQVFQGPTLGPPSVMLALERLMCLLHSGGPGVEALSFALRRRGFTQSRMRWTHRVLKDDEALDAASCVDEINTQLNAFDLLKCWHAEWCEVLGLSHGFERAEPPQNHIDVSLGP
ncbi:MAG: hypothetical protein ACE366_28680 [Bradymonadia bacterium]